MAMKITLLHGDERMGRCSGHYFDGTGRVVEVVDSMMEFHAASSAILGRLSEAYSYKLGRTVA
jgi:hypothetical protein